MWYLIFISVTFVKNLMLFEEFVDINVMSNMLKPDLFFFYHWCAFENYA